MESKNLTLKQLLAEKRVIDGAIKDFEESLAVMFVDIWGYTSFVENTSNINGITMADQFFKIVEPAVQNYSGVLLKKIGDEAMTIFTAPLLAVRAATAIQQGLMAYNRDVSDHDRINAKIGMDYGKVILEPTEDESINDVYGDVVNMAARLTKVAGKDQVLLTKTLCDLVLDAQGIHCRNFSTVTLKGKKVPTEVHELVWRDDRAIPRKPHQETNVECTGTFPVQGLENFNVLTRYLDGIQETQNRQAGYFGKIFERLDTQGKELATLTANFKNIKPLSNTVEEHTKKLAVIRGVGVAVSAIYAGLLALLSFLKHG